MKEMEVKDKEKIIYEALRKFQKGNYDDRSFAFDCIGYLTNDSLSDSLETKLTVLEKKIKEYIGSKL